MPLSTINTKQAIDTNTQAAKNIKSFEEIIKQSQNYKGKIEQEDAAKLLQEDPSLKLIIRSAITTTALFHIYSASYYVTTHTVEEGSIIVSENGFKADFPNPDSMDVGTTSIEELISWLGMLYMPDDALKLQPKHRICR